MRAQKLDPRRKKEPACKQFIYRGDHDLCSDCGQAHGPRGLALTTLRVIEAMYPEIAAKAAKLARDLTEEQ